MAYFNESVAKKWWSLTITQNCYPSANDFAKRQGTKRARRSQTGLENPGSNDFIPCGMGDPVPLPVANAQCDVLFLVNLLESSRMSYDVVYETWRHFRLRMRNVTCF